MTAQYSQQVGHSPLINSARLVEKSHKRYGENRSSEQTPTLFSLLGEA